MKKIYKPKNKEKQIRNLYETSQSTMKQLSQQFGIFSQHVRRILTKEA